VNDIFGRMLDAEVELARARMERALTELAA